MFGVVVLLISYFLLGVSPCEHFLTWTVALKFGLLTFRFFDYRKKKWHYFMFDFCYFSNFLMLIFLICFPKSKTLFYVTLACCNGPLPWSIPMFRNSLVVHDIDKMTSLFIHAFPPKAMFILTWVVPYNPQYED